ncbi:hypothetical protein [Actinoplanes derwentensis]|uniref:Uncharacterized protein n=1 Tax=Actinoplanes derwentensis TaxID=113562 RepID=A0A1H2D5Z9_9ACTN|nr:hypothetical protein [Actinoplanes derwentensis]GID85633.1 hypothetical protein Ade03nite_45570 [Actinoplanes derwentensis]SDT78161.1 hypothetical protein SAMN04489716_8258 [Actinoplanes derwentensis]
MPSVAAFNADPLLQAVAAVAVKRRPIRPGGCLRVRHSAVTGLPVAEFFAPTGFLPVADFLPVALFLIGADLPAAG